MGHVLTLEEAGLIKPETEVLDWFIEWVEDMHVSSDNFNVAPPCKGVYIWYFTYNYEKDAKMTAFLDV